MTTSELKLRFIGDLIANEEVVSLIDYANKGTYPEDLIYTHIFPFWKVDRGTLQDVGAYVGLKIDYPNVAANDLYKNFRLSVLILCHHSIMKVEKKNGTRIDLLGEILGQMWTWDKSGEFQLELLSDKEDVMSEDYLCRTMVFASRTSNNVRCGVKGHAG